MFNNVIYLRSTISTMDVAAELSRTVPAVSAHGTAIVADVQTSGRGRHGRRWHSDKRGDLLVSYVLSPRSALVGQMPVLAGLAAAQSVDELALTKSQIKWPNDVLIDGKKVGGVIAEAVMTGSETVAILGIGLNLVFDAAAAPELRSPAANLSEFAGLDIDRDDAYRVLTARISALYSTLERGVSLIPEWKQRLVTLGQRVTVADVGDAGASADGFVSGIAEDVDDLGRLLVRTEGGYLEAVSAGEVTVISCNG